MLPGWFPTYLGLEGAATQIRGYEAQFVHGLLQTEGYAHAVVEQGMKGASSEDIERRVALRIERQKLLVAERAPEVHIVLDEATVRRVQGGRDVMRGQLEHLIELASLPHLTLQIMPFSHGWHPGESGTFTILTFPESELSDVVFLEQLTSALYLDKREDVAQYAKAMTELSAQCPSPEDSVRLLRDALSELA